MLLKRVATSLLPVLLSPALAFSTQFYVSPAGSPAGDGSLAKPWDLQTALRQPTAVKPGDTIWLRGGVYKGKYASGLTGTAAAPITVRSYPGEQATIDGYGTAKLLSAVSSTASHFSLSHLTNIQRGHVLHIDSEDIYVKAILAPTLLETLRGWNGTKPAAHNAGALASRRGNILSIMGHYTWYWGFEVMSSDPVRITSQSGSAPIEIPRGTGIVFAGSNNKLINVVIHDAADAIGYPPGATNNEIYGCILYNTGWQGPDRGHGHGIYIQSNPGTRHQVREVISFNNFATGMKAFGYGASAIDVTFDGVISFNNGSLRFARFPKETNLFVGTDRIPADLIQISNSTLYHTPSKVGENMHLGFSLKNNGRVTLQNNLIVGGHVGLDVDYWKTVVFTGNTLQTSTVNSGTGAQSFAIAKLASGTTKANWNWNNNSYYDNSPIFEGGARYTFGFPGLVNGYGGGWLAFKEWQKGTGFDAASKYYGGAVSGEWTYVRPNQYEAGRAHIVVVNWSMKNSVSVNPGGVLRVGDIYEIRDAQNYFGPPLTTGTYTGSTIQIPMSLFSVARPVGNVPTVPSHTAPHFGVFVLRKTN